MMRNPSISVILPVYNAELFVKEAVAGVLAQTYRDFELIVVDDASSDRSGMILSRFSDERLRVVRHAVNSGAIAARNTALALSRGEFIACQDADDISRPDRLERQITFLRAHPEAGLLGVCFRKIDEFGRVLLEKSLPTTDEEIRAGMQKNNCLCSPGVMFRKSLLKKTGGFRRIAGPSGEDYDLFLRLMDHASVAALDSFLYDYRLNTGGIMASAWPEDTSAAFRLIRRIAERRGATGIDPLDAGDPELLAEIAALEKRIRNRPIQPISRRRSRHLFALAEDFYRARKLPEARRWTVRAILHDPFRGDPWRLLVGILRS